MQFSTIQTLKKVELKHYPKSRIWPASLVLTWDFGVSITQKVSHRSRERFVKKLLADFTNPGEARASYDLTLGRHVISFANPDQAVMVSLYLKNSSSSRLAS